MAETIQDLILLYGELNRIYSDGVPYHAFSFDNQKE